MNRVMKFVVGGALTIVMALLFMPANVWAADTTGQIAGPFPCQNDFFKYREIKTANAKNGSTIYVGAPDGAGTLLAHQFIGSVATVNVCSPPK